MQNILIIGAGRSSGYLIDYLLERSTQFNWQITVADISEQLALEKTKNHPNSRTISFDINNKEQRTREIDRAEIVVSMLPASMHLKVAQDCILFKKNMVTASYVSQEIAALHKDAVKYGIILMNEIGLDPGIDHMSAMQIINKIKSNGGKINSFKSYCGGLIAPESNNNPWGYKFTWNPRNVVLAGQGTACYIENGKYKYLPYNRLFKNHETVQIPEIGSFDAYANRDSLSYRKAYGLENIPSILRGTLRYEGFCKAWHALIQIGLTDDSYTIRDSEKMTYKELLNAFMPQKDFVNTKMNIADFISEKENSVVVSKLEWLGLFEDNLIPLKNGTPAQILQDLLEKKWKLEGSDKDLIIMQHQFEYNISEKQNKLISSLAVTGENSTKTAMAKTVGLPAAIVTKLILLRKLKVKGVQIPVAKEIYEPVLKELEEFGIAFNEK